MKQIPIFCLFLTLSLLLTTCDLEKGEVKTISPAVIYNNPKALTSLRWKTKETPVTTVKWSLTEDFSDEVIEVDVENTDHYFNYKFSDVAPGTTVFYEVVFDDHVYKGSFITPVKEEKENLNFLIYGDTRTYPRVHDEVAHKMLQLIEKDPSFKTFALHAGDIVSDGSFKHVWSKEFLDKKYVNLRKLVATLPLFACLGNHDGSGKLFKKYMMPKNSETYYSIDYGPVHVTVIDTNISYAPDSEQYKWLVNDIESSDKEWLVALFHHPGWSAEGGHSNDKNVQKYLHPVFVDLGVDMVVSGHNHYYARAVVDDIQYLTVGGAGAPLRTPDRDAEHVVAAEKEYHFGKVMIKGQTLQLDIVDLDDNLLDTVTLSH